MHEPATPGDDQPADHPEEDRADDPAHEEAMRLGREYRESQKMVYDEEED